MYGCLKWKVPFCRGTPPTGGMFFYLHYQPTPILYPTVNEKCTAIVPTIHCMTKPAFVWYGEVAVSARGGARRRAVPDPVRLRPRVRKRRAGRAGLRGRGAVACVCGTRSRGALCSIATDDIYEPLYYMKPSMGGTRGQRGSETEDNEVKRIG